MFAVGTKQEAIEYLAAIQNQYVRCVFENMNIDESQDKLQERVKTVKFTILAIKTISPILISYGKKNAGTAK